MASFLFSGGDGNRRLSADTPRRFCFAPLKQTAN